MTVSKKNVGILITCEILECDMKSYYKNVTRIRNVLFLFQKF